MSTPEQPQQPGQPPRYDPPQQPYAPPQPQYGQPQYAQPQYAQPPHGYPAAFPGPGGPFDGAQSAEDLSRPLYGASFGEAVRRFFRNYANFSGRASRSEYWFAQLFLLLVGFIPLILLMIGGIGLIVALANAPYETYDSYSPGNSALSAAGGGTVILAVIGGAIYFLYALATIVPTIAISWRRLHDANLPGPLWLLSLGSYIPFVNYIGWAGSIAVLVLMILPSKIEGRRFTSSK